ncbi:bifunctional 3-(3-hydroxy-phenyl)propionate/3-hydroxycinnamic acid hydroxylase [Phaeovulum sp. W22_SRMD_FR3]|uniref:bifunctional 3-(3-hydroxy-phenyl)propionate/3-hydroxycinnamic acid hydroxylase n=1 Tax=Phaeovulum sp. W22_SRMD_FR3 TaxID=3240274 RepID=UPI003F94B2EE
MPGPFSDTDILVVGAGPTGLLLTNLLGGMGVRTTIVERNPSTVQEPRAVSIDDESMRALQAAGLAEDVAQFTVKGYGSIYRGPSGKVFAEVKPHIKEYGFDKRNAFEQPVFEDCLRRALSRHGSVTAHFDTTLETVAQDSAGVTAQVSGPAGPLQIRARYMVACDGGRSLTRKLLDIALEGSTFTEPWLIVDLHSTRNSCFHTEVFCNPGRSAISLPGPDGIRRYEFKLNDGETVAEAESEGFARRLLAEVGPDAQEPIRRQQVYTFHARTAERWREGRIFLAGDAAHLTPPFAGQGMNSGLRDAHNLAWKLDEALRLADPEPVLDSYEVERKPHAREMINLALTMGKVMIPSSPLAGFFIRTGMSLLGLYGPAKTYMVQMKYKPRPRFAAGLLRPDGRPTKATGVGRMIPQPLVVTPRREECLLDALLPDTPVALIFDENPQEVLAPEMQARFEAAGATVIGLTPEWVNPRNGTFTIVRDRSRFFSEAPFAGYLGQVLLLRRDRYVAGAAPVARAEDLLPLLHSMRAAPSGETEAVAPFHRGVGRRA